MTVFGKTFSKFPMFPSLPCCLAGRGHYCTFQNFNLILFIHSLLCYCCAWGICDTYKIYDIKYIIGKDSHNTENVFFSCIWFISRLRPHHPQRAWSRLIYFTYSNAFQFHLLFCKWSNIGPFHAKKVPFSLSIYPSRLIPYLSYWDYCIKKCKLLGVSLI
jgi:hypothetical protein